MKNTRADISKVLTVMNKLVTKSNVKCIASICSLTQREELYIRDFKVTNLKCEIFKLLGTP